MSPLQKRPPNCDLQELLQSIITSLLQGSYFWPEKLLGGTGGLLGDIWLYLEQDVMWTPAEEEH